MRPLVAELRRRFSVSAAETGDRMELYRRAGVGVAVTASDRAHVVEVLDAAERLVAAASAAVGRRVPAARLSVRGARRACTRSESVTADLALVPLAPRRAECGATAPGASLRALIRNAVCPRIRCCGRTARPTTSQPRCSVSHDRGSVQHCCSRSASTVRDSCVTVAT